LVFIISIIIIMSDMYGYRWWLRVVIMVDANTNGVVCCMGVTDDEEEKMGGCCVLRCAYVAIWCNRVMSCELMVTRGRIVVRTLIIIGIIIIIIIIVVVVVVVSA